MHVLAASLASGLPSFQPDGSKTKLTHLGLGLGLGLGVVVGVGVGAGVKVVDKQDAPGQG